MFSLIAYWKNVRFFILIFDLFCCKMVIFLLLNPAFLVGFQPPYELFDATWIMCPIIVFDPPSVSQLFYLWGSVQEWQIERK